MLSALKRCWKIKSLPKELNIHILFKIKNIHTVRYGIKKAFLLKLALRNTTPWRERRSQLWREGSQHHRVQSDFQLPHPEMHFQPQPGVLTDAFIPGSPAGIREGHICRAPLHGIPCTEERPGPAPSWTEGPGVVWWGCCLRICWFKCHPSLSEQNQITLPFFFVRSQECITQFLSSDCCTQITLFPIFCPSTIICYFYVQHITVSTFFIKWY